MEEMQSIMPRHMLQRYLPDRRQIRDHKHLRVFGERLHDPNLWHFNRRSVAGALGVGVFISLLPIPGQMLVAAAAAIWLRLNLPLAVATVWITNPLTMPPIFYFNYKVGLWLLNSRPHFHFVNPSLDWLIEHARIIAAPLLLGSLIVGIVFGSLSYVAARVAWRCHILRKRRLSKSDTPIA